MPDLRMPDLRRPDLSRTDLAMIVVVVAGIVAMLVGLLSSSSEPNSANPAQNSNRDVEPVAPIDPQDAAAKPGSSGAPLNPTDPFAISFGKSDRRKVTFRVTGNGSVNLSVSYRDHQKTASRVVNGSYSKTRTIRGRYPMVSLVIQVPPGIPGAATRATCEITIDGIQVDKKVTTKPGYLMFCIARRSPDLR